MLGGVESGFWRAMAKLEQEADLNKMVLRIPGLRSSPLVKKINLGSTTDQQDPGPSYSLCEEDTGWGGLHTTWLTRDSCETRVPEKSQGFSGHIGRSALLPLLCSLVVRHTCWGTGAPLPRDFGFTGKRTQAGAGVVV